MIRMLLFLELGSIKFGLSIGIFDFIKLNLNFCKWEMRLSLRSWRSSLCLGVCADFTFVSA